MLSTKNIRRVKSALGSKEWKKVISHWKHLSKNSDTFISELSDSEIINEIEKFVINSKDINFTTTDLELDYESKVGAISAYNLQFLYSFNKNSKFINLFKHFKTPKIYTLIYYALEGYHFYFNILKTSTNDMILFISIEKPLKTNYNFSLHLPSPINKKRIINFTNIEQIEYFIEEKTNFSNVLNSMDINIHFNGYHIGKLIANKNKNCLYSLKLAKINKANFKLYYSHHYDNDCYKDEEILPEYKIYKVNHIQNIYLITTFEHEDYGTYDFITINDEMASNENLFKDYIENSLFS